MLLKREEKWQMSDGGKEKSTERHQVCQKNRKQAKKTTKKHL